MVCGIVIEYFTFTAWHFSVKTPSSDSMLAPPVASGEPQAYVPYDYAKDCIAKVCKLCFFSSYNTEHST